MDLFCGSFWIFAASLHVSVKRRWRYDSLASDIGKITKQPEIKFCFMHYITDSIRILTNFLFQILKGKLLTLASFLRCRLLNADRFQMFSFSLHFPKSSISCGFDGRVRGFCQFTQPCNCYILKSSTYLKQCVFATNKCLPQISEINTSCVIIVSKETAEIMTIS